MSNTFNQVCTAARQRTEAEFMNLANTLDEQFNRFVRVRPLWVAKNELEGASILLEADGDEEFNEWVWQNTRLPMSVKVIRVSQHNGAFTAEQATFH
jgi:hypothetical protein